MGGTLIFEALAALEGPVQNSTVARQNLGVGYVSAPKLGHKALWMHQMARRGIRFTYQPTAEMAADSLTKGLGASRLPQIREDLRLIED